MYVRTPRYIVLRTYRTYVRIYTRTGTHSSSSIHTALTLPSHSTSPVLQSSSALTPSHGTLPGHPPLHSMQGTRQPPHNNCD